MRKTRIVLLVTVCLVLVLALIQVVPEVFNSKQGTLTSNVITGMNFVLPTGWAEMTLPGGHNEDGAEKMIFSFTESGTSGKRNIARISLVDGPPTTRATNDDLNFSVIDSIDTYLGSRFFDQPVTILSHRETNIGGVQADVIEGIGTSPYSPLPSNVYVVFLQYSGRFYAFQMVADSLNYLKYRVKFNEFLSSVNFVTPKDREGQLVEYQPQGTNLSLSAPNNWGMNQVINSDSVWINLGEGVSLEINQSFANSDDTIQTLLDSESEARNIETQYDRRGLLFQNVLHRQVEPLKILEANLGKTRNGVDYYKVEFSYINSWGNPTTSVRVGILRDGKWYGFDFTPSELQTRSQFDGMIDSLKFR